jgi:hypothetical protein
MHVSIDFALFILQLQQKHIANNSSRSYFVIQSCLIMSAQENSFPASELSDQFHDLVSELSRILGPSSGIDSDDVDAKELRNVMESYYSNEKEWRRYALADRSRSYTRNLVDKGNGKSNLVTLSHKLSVPS